MAEEKKMAHVLFYYQAMCFTLLFMLIIFTLVGLWGILSFTAPNMVVANNAWMESVTFDSYVENNFRERDGLYFYRYSQDTTRAAGLTSEKVEAKRLASRAYLLSEERRGGGREILLWLTVVVVCLPIYLLHHRVVRRVQKVRESVA